MAMKIQEAINLLSKVIGRTDIKFQNQDRKLVAEARKTFIEYYKNNPQAFIEDFIRIVDGKTNEEIPFKLNRAQTIVVDKLHKRYIAVPKARQLGMTTLTNALALHHCLFIRNGSAALMAVKNSNAEENLHRIRTMFASMPSWVQEITMECNEKKGHTNNKTVWTFRAKCTTSDARMEVFSAESENSTRGKHITFWHWTETAFSTVAHEIFTSAFPALNRKQNSVIIMESTGNGTSGFYYDVCTGKRQGFEVVFLPWYLDDGYAIETPPLKPSEKEYIADLMGVEEIPEFITDEQAAWYRSASELAGKAKTQQEYPIDVNQVFMATNNSFFTVKCINKVMHSEPLHRVNFREGLLQITEGGHGFVYSKPNPEFEYLLSADTSEGINDPTSISIFDPDGKEVLYWSQHIEPHECTLLIHLLAKHYNDAFIAVERNGSGAYIVNTLQNILFYHKLFHENNKAGILTNISNKPVMLATLQNLILEDKIQFRNHILSEEMKTFEADTMRAQKEKHDDCVMSSAIGAYVFSLTPPKRRRIIDAFRDISPNTSRPRRRFA